MSRETQLIKSIIILLFGTVIPKLSTIIILPLITAKLTIAEIGIYDLVLTMGAMLLPIITLQLHAAGFRFLIDKKEDVIEKSKIITNTVAICIFTALGASTLLSIVLLNTGIDNILAVIIIGYLITDVTINLVKQLARGLTQNKLYSQGTMVQSLIEISIIVVATLQGLLSLNIVLISIVLGQLIATIFITQRLKLHRFIKVQYLEKKMAMELIQYSGPLIPSSVSSWVLNACDKVIIARYLSIESVAINAIAVKLPGLFSYAQNAVNMAWQENASLSINDEDKSMYYSKVFDDIFSVLVSILALIIAAAPMIFSILIRGDFDASYSHMSIRFIAALFSSMSAYLGGIYIALKKSKNMGVTTMLAALICVIINLMLIGDLGLYASSIASVLSYLLLFCYRAHNLQKYIHITYKRKKIVFSILALIIMAYICAYRFIWLDILNIMIALVLSIALCRKYIYVIKALYIK